MKSKRFKTVREFWDTIDEWTDPTIQHAIFHENVPNHEEFYEECLAHDKWTRATAAGMTKGYTHTLHDHNLKTHNPNRKHRENWGRWFAIPKPETFPKISKFFEDNKRQYKYPVISKLDAGESINAHNHGGVGVPFIYNMCINFPKNTYFAIYPTGFVPYTPGDIYKLYIHNDHSVVNKSKTDRYHIMIRPTRAF